MGLTSKIERVVCDQQNPCCILPSTWDILPFTIYCHGSALMPFFCQICLFLIPPCCTSSDWDELYF